MTKVAVAVRSEAAAWLARLRADDRSINYEAEFHAWLAEDRERAIAFEMLSEIWELAGSAGHVHYIPSTLPTHK